MNIIEEVIELEWPMFHNVNNEGGRADCQYNRRTFTEMRASQYSAWDIPTLESYRDDLKAAKARDWNLLTEKYGRMMASTAPDQYARIAHLLPPVSDEKKELVEEIVLIQTACRQAFADKYPKLAAAGRKMYTAQDSDSDTSYETYITGEFQTYSEKTLELYRAHLIDCLVHRKNMVEKMMETLVRFYGYKSLEEAEARSEG